MIYVYHDADHNDVELFPLLSQAKTYAEKHWPDAEEDGEWGSSGSTNKKNREWTWGEYVTIYEKEIRQENV